MANYQSPCRIPGILLLTFRIAAERILARVEISPTAGPEKHTENRHSWLMVAGRRRVSGSREDRKHLPTLPEIGCPIKRPEAGAKVPETCQDKHKEHRQEGLAFS